MIFNYVNKFVKEHATIASPSEFEVSDEIYNDFVKWLKDKDYSYKRLPRQGKLLYLWRPVFPAYGQPFQRNELDYMG